jgi:hypothetical protein
LDGLEINVRPRRKLQELNEENLGILDVSECLCEWLFRSTRFAHYRQRTDEILDAMIRVSQANKIWKADFYPVDWYECTWDDFYLNRINRFLYCT